jgi:hypothetical protein
MGKPSSSQAAGQPRPLLQAVAAQQRRIQEQDHALGVLASQNEMLRAELIVIKSQLHHVAEVAGLTGHMDQIRTTAMRHLADQNNPAQPVPDPPSQPAVETTEEALAPDAMDNVQNPGMTPGSVDDLAADAHDVPYNPGEVPGTQTAPYNQLVDVTAPVAGTETHVPLEQTKIETDVRVGDPMNPEVAFPLTPAFSSNRTMASIRLARLQVEAGIAAGDDLTLGEHIASSDLTDEAIATQIATLSSVKKAASRQRPAGVVPRAAGVSRTTPSLTSEASLSAEAAIEGAEDEDLFLD